MDPLIDFEIPDIDEEVFIRIPETEGFINKNGLLYRHDTYEFKDVKKNKINNGSIKFKINGKTYILNTVIKKLFGYNKYMNGNIKNIDNEIIEINNEIFKQIPETNVYLSKCGKLFKNNEIINVNDNLTKRFKINGKRYYLRKTIKQLFNDNQNEIKPKRKQKDKKEFEQKIIESGFYQGKPILKDIPDDMKQLKEYRNIQLKDCYYYSTIKFGLYYKIKDTNQFYELQNKYPEYTTKYNGERKYYNVKTINNKQIPITLNIFHI